MTIAVPLCPVLCLHGVCVCVCAPVQVVEKYLMQYKIPEGVRICSPTWNEFIAEFVERCVKLSVCVRHATHSHADTINLHTLHSHSHADTKPAHYCTLICRH